MVLVALLFVVVGAQRVWQLSSEVSPVKFLSSDYASKIVPAVTCENNAVDFTVSMWTWHERVHLRKQFFSAVDPSGTLRLTKGPGSLLELYLDSNRTSVYVNLTSAGAKTWELVTVVVTNVGNAVTLCAGTAETTNCKSTALAPASMSIGSLQTAVYLGGISMEMLAARVYFSALSLDDIKAIPLRDKARKPSSSLDRGLYILPGQTEYSCLTTSQVTYSRTTAQGLTDNYEFAIDHRNYYKAILDLKVLSGDADLVVSLRNKFPTGWSSTLPGSDSLTINYFWDGMFAFGDRFAVSVVGYTDGPVTYTLSIAQWKVDTRMQVAAFAVGEGESAGDAPQVDIESKDVLLGPTEMKTSELGYVLLAAIAVLVGLGLCVCITRRNKEQRMRTDDGFIRLDA